MGRRQHVRRSRKAKLILSIRVSDLQSYERAISDLQKGIQANWTRDQYLAAWDQENKQRADDRRSCNPSNRISAEIPSLDSSNHLQRIMQRFLDMFIEYRDLLRQSKPELTAIGNPN